MSIVPSELIEQRIFLIRGKKVMLDKDLAELYGVPPKRLNEQVKRNIERFPSDFMFQLTDEEAESSRSQIATLKRGHNIKYLPYAFTEQGVAMLSSVLNSKGAIEVNIQIMRTFTRLRELLLTHKDLQQKMDALEKKYDTQFRVVFDAIRQLLEPPEDRKKKRYGFLADRKNSTQNTENSTQN